MQKWEYQRHTIHEMWPNPVPARDHPLHGCHSAWLLGFNEAENRLDDLGAEGWEAVGFAPRAPVVWTSKDPDAGSYPPTHPVGAFEVLLKRSLED